MAAALRREILDIRANRNIARRKPEAIDFRCHSRACLLRAALGRRTNRRPARC